MAISRPDGTHGLLPSVAIIGLGLIGGSIVGGLRRAGWMVLGRDIDSAVTRAAAERKFIENEYVDQEVDLIVLAFPVSGVAVEAQRLLETTTSVVTDVGSVKSVIDDIANPRFVGGHPMAGSEQDGLEGANETLFDGANWVLTPSEASTPESVALVERMVESLGARVIRQDATTHDEIVASVSHVPRLAAAALMRATVTNEAETEEVLRLAAGGFRDMTRVASGRPDIWLDICRENRTAILDALGHYMEALAEVRDAVARNDTDSLRAFLEEARLGRAQLPSVRPGGEALVELRIPVPDRAGVLAEITTAADELNVSVADIDMVHGSEGDYGVVILLIDARNVEPLTAALEEKGYRPTQRSTL